MLIPGVAVEVRDNASLFKFGVKEIHGLSKAIRHLLIIKEIHGDCGYV